MTAPTTAPDVTSVVPLLMVTSKERSLAFYIEGLGFKIQNRWEPDGKLGWCWISLGGARRPRVTGAEVGNSSWKVSFADPDGYRINFSSPTHLPEETLLSETVL